MNYNRVVFDLEGNGLLDTISKIWCIVAYNIDEDRWYEGTWEDEKSMDTVYRELSSNNNVIIGHNILGYDIPALRSIPGIRTTSNIIDTYVISRLFNPDRGFHSLEDWGEKFGVKKVQQEQWTEWDENMLYRCKEDVRINTLLYEELSKECGEDLCYHVYS